MYTRVPRAIRGVELSCEEILARAAELQEDLRADARRWGGSRTAHEATALAGDHAFLLHRLAYLQNTK